MGYSARDWHDGDLVTAEDLNALETAVQAVSDQSGSTAAKVDRIKMANSSMGSGAPTGMAPVGWYYTDIATGDIYRMEA